MWLRAENVVHHTVFLKSRVLLSWGSATFSPPDIPRHPLPPTVATGKLEWRHTAYWSRCQRVQGHPVSLGREWRFHNEAEGGSGNHEQVRRRLRSLAAMEIKRGWRLWHLCDPTRAQIAFCSSCSKHGAGGRLGWGVRCAGIEGGDMIDATSSNKKLGSTWAPHRCYLCLLPVFVTCLLFCCVAGPATSSSGPWHQTLTRELSVCSFSLPTTSAVQQSRWWSWNESKQIADWSRLTQWDDIHNICKLSLDVERNSLKQFLVLKIFLFGGRFWEKNMKHI